jgi:hypothetical protein
VSSHRQRQRRLGCHVIEDFNRVLGRDRSNPACLALAATHVPTSLAAAYHLQPVRPIRDVRHLENQHQTSDMAQSPANDSWCVYLLNRCLTALKQQIAWATF